MDDPAKPTIETREANLSTEHQREGDARRPSDTLDKGQKSTMRRSESPRSPDHAPGVQGRPAQSVVTQALSGASRTCGSSTSWAP